MRRGLGLSLFGAVALLAILALIWRQNAAKATRTQAPAAPAAAMGPLPVEVHRVRPEAFEVSVYATGTLVARESVELVSELSRRLLRVHAQEGQTVTKGQVLFELDSAELRAELAKVAVQARLAQTTLAREQKLLPEGLTTEQQLEAAQANLDAVVAQRRGLEVTLSKTVVRAPFAGQLGLRRVSEGAWVSPSTVLTTLQDVTELKVDFTLPERYAGQVGVGAELRVKVTGLGESFRGKVAAIEPRIDSETRSLLVRGVLPPDARLVPGAFAEVTLPLRASEALLIPAIAVVPGVEGRRVFVVEDGVARARNVELGVRTTDRVQVLAGLSSGDAVVVSNLLRVREGVALALTAPTQAAPTQAAPKQTP
ncbi:MAG: MexH family multidrug efflux transporter periplasmic adaptor subunit [Pseudomonadota bacterium]|jgi:membrane fusion protein (multidrug efflux system)